MPNQLTIPSASELSLVIEKELVKLPTDAAHNYFHQLSERAEQTREHMTAISLASLVLCGAELEHLQGEPLRQSGSPWKQWVKEHCDFSHKTATKYIKALKCARAGLIEGLDPAIVPEKAPSLMSADELQDTCTALANALRGLGGRRQLYLSLDIIATPAASTIEGNRNTVGGPKKPAAPRPDIEVDRADAKAAIIPTLKPLDDFLKMNRHHLLDPADVRELDNALQSARDILKPYLQ